MIIPTHLLFAHKLYQQFPTALKNTIPYHGFLYGSIKPDIDSNYSPQEHFFEKSLHHISKMFYTLKSSSLDSWTYAVNFGVITHYVADYFCLYHSNVDLRKKPISEHIKYEFELHKIIKSKALPTNLNLDNNSSFEAILVDLYTQYKDMPAGLKTDAYFSSKAITMISNAIISIYLQEKNPVVIY